MDNNHSIIPAAAAVASSSVIPCYNGVPCMTHSEDIAKRPALQSSIGCAKVIAGHFDTDLINILESIDNLHDGSTCDRGWNSNTQTTETTSMNFDCLVALREPIDRLISFYYFFVQKTKPEYNNKKFGELSTDDVHRLVHFVASTTIVTVLSKHLYPVDYNMSQNDIFSWDEKIKAADEILSKCVLIVMEEWDQSVQLVETVVPWLDGHLSATPALNQASSSHETIQNLAPEIVTLLKELLDPDIRLYTRGLDIFHSQLQSFHINTF